MQPAADRVPRITAACAEAIGTVEDIARSPLHYPAWMPSLDLCRAHAESLCRELHRERTGTGRIVVIGRTKAGKSTLRYVLTGDGKEGIGRGGQRTTRRLIEYRWLDFDVVDTPGVGGVHTDDDATIALDAASDADLVLWVTTSDGVQLATEAPVLQAALGRPLLVLVNHKSTFSAEEIAAGINDAHVLADRAGLDARIYSRLLDAGLHDAEIVHVHLGLSRKARHEVKDPRSERQSGILATEKAIETAALRAVEGREATSSRRTQIESLQIIRTLNEMASLIDSHRRHLRAEHHTLVQAIRRCKAASEMGSNIAVTGLRDKALAQVEAALRAAGTQPNRGRADVALRDRIDELVHDIGAAASLSLAHAHVYALDELPAEFRQALDDAGVQTTLSLEPLALAGDPQIGVAAQRGIKIGFSVLAAVAFVATGGLAGLVAAAVADDLGRAAKRFVPSKEGEQARRDASVQTNQVHLGAALAEWRTDLLADIAEATEVLTAPAHTHAEQLRERIERYAEWVAVLRRRAGELSAASETLPAGR